MNTKKKRAIKCIIAAIVARKLKRKNDKREWVKPWLKRRKELSICKQLLTELKHEDSVSFKNFLRCDPDLFMKLLHLVENKIKRSTTIMRSSISVEERLSLTLRYLATGESFRSLSYSFRISPASISRIIPEVCEQLYLALKDEYMKIPNSQEEWKQIAKEFYDKWNFPNCLGAIDGKHIVLQAPSKSGSVDNYKNTFSIVLMALVDANYKFVYVDIGTNGRTSDGGVFKECTLNGALECGELSLPEDNPLPGMTTPMPYVMVGDEAFPLKENLMKPYPMKMLENEKRIFNYRLSRARRVVENAFGILANRFRVFRSPIPLDPEKVEKIVLCACTLHNLMRSESTAFNTVDTEYPGLVPLTCEDDGVNLSSTRARIVREEFVKYFLTSGQVPWQYNVLSDII